MRIAMLSWESMHSIAIGGIAPHVSELSASLARKGHEVHVYTRVGDDQPSYSFVDGVHYHRCAFEMTGDFVASMERMCDSFVWHMVETEHFVGGPFDIIHGHDWLTARAFIRMKNERARQVVMTVHSTEYGRCGNSVWEDDLSRRIRDAEWEGTFVADRVICVSKTLGEEVRTLYNVPTDKVFCIYNGVDASRYDPPVNVKKARADIDVGMDDPMMFFAGRLTWQKGPDILVEAIPSVLSANPRTKFVFAGDGDMRGGLEERSKSLGISKSTRFLGYRKGQELVSLFKSADVVCVPSRNEPFGIVILEAWSATKPVVATNIGGPREFVHHRYNGLTSDAVDDQISDNVNMLIDDRDQAQEMGRNGRREVVNKFSWEGAAIATESVYRSLMLEGAYRGAQSEDFEMAKRTNGNGGTSGKTAVMKPRTASVLETLTSMEPTQDEIKARAFQIYMARNGKPGDPNADWLQAERELRAEKSKAAPKRAGK